MAIKEKHERYQGEITNKDEIILWGDRSVQLGLVEHGILSYHLLLQY